jgi:hypothetical protein
MKLAIQRHGIVIRTIEITGDSARIGSAPECEVMLDDPYLAGHVADLVKRADGWYIVDTAASLEGVSRDGARIEEEKIAGGSTYGVGGFELVPQLGAEAPRAAAPQSDAANMKTMMETELPPAQASSREFPKTMMETEMPPEVRGDVAPQPRAQTPQNVAFAAPAGAAKARGLEGFQRVETRPGTTPVPTPGQPAAPKKSKAPLIAVGAIGVLIVLVVIIGVVAGSKKKAPPKPVQTATAPAPTPVEPAPEPAAPPTPDALLAKLDADKALGAWEAALTTAPDPAVQDRYAALALELALLHSAANDTAKANSYFERVVKFGRPESDAVKAAKKRLGR